MMYSISMNTQFVAYLWGKRVEVFVQFAVTALIVVMGHLIAVMLALFGGLNISDAVAAVAGVEFITLLLVVFLDIMFATFTPEDR
ncbi:hypothetical protein E4H12_05335 [Candidatus Thorarchaeota archaeon]|nr:MAG: hypothetical protein E4H12_05335 [Candidatus Thorarchaeota archaeon]